MKVAIIGGKLQGTEAVYLAKAAGIESILIDKNINVPASGIADKFVVGDIVARDKEVIDAMCEADWILPANENDAVLEAVVSICEEYNLSLAFDIDSYKITKSKIISDRLIRENGIPCPMYYPEGHAPYIIKPSGESGSTGVIYAEEANRVEAFIKNCERPEEWVVQEYVTGPSYSIEVIGCPGNYRTYTITQIHMDAGYDCCKVTAPCDLGEKKNREFAKIAIKLAELVNLYGIMDVEVIDDGELKVLEIDARIPSQTPIAVLYSSGMNLIKELGDITLYGKFLNNQTDDRHFSTYEHYNTVDGHLRQEGEHIMSQAGPLALKTNFCGSRYVMMNCNQENGEFRGIFINWANTGQELETIRTQTRNNLERLLDGKVYNNTGKQTDRTGC